MCRVTWAHPEFGEVLATCSFDRTTAVWEEQGMYINTYHARININVIVVQLCNAMLYMYKWVRSLHPLGSLRSLQLLRVWLSLASLAQSHGCDEVGKERD